MSNPVSTRLVLYPYNLKSHSALVLAEALGIKRVRSNGKYRWFPNHRVVNWGNSHIPTWDDSGILNHPVYVSRASNKLLTFDQLDACDVPIPDLALNMEQAAQMLANGPKWKGLKHAVVCRTLTRANSGRGIVLAETAEQLVPAPLYTRYTPKSAEYRVHVFRDFGVIDVQQKKRDTHTPEDKRNEYIRNHDAGWVFCRENVSPPDVVLQKALDAVVALQLSFGAVDIGWHKDIGPIVYEVNTAPGLEGQTLTSYVETFKKYL